MITRVAEVTPGIYRQRLDLTELFRDRDDRLAFEHRWEEFESSSPDHKQLFERDGDALLYLTESFVPEVADERPHVLLVLGNPASHSVRSGICFAFEGAEGMEHRFWRALRKADWLSLPEEESGAVETASRNARRRDQLLAGAYDSPFLLGIEMFFTFPSPASTPVWAGVSGLKTLFGRSKLRLIEEAERERLASTISSFIRRGAVVAFQRDAYEGLRAALAPRYSLESAKEGELISPSAAGCPTPLFGAPPTRHGYSKTFQSALRRYAAMIEGWTGEDNERRGC